LVIQKNNDIPYYLQLAEYLIGKIKIGEFSVGDKIPSENELSQQFNINRHTVRQAINKVTGMGWLTTIKGKGSYVKFKPPLISYTISEQTRFTDNMNHIGKRHSSSLIGWEKDNPTEKEARVLHMESKEWVYRLEILRYVEDNPLSLTTTMIIERDVPQLEQYLDNFHSLYAILESHYHFKPLRVCSNFQASLPNIKDCTYLEMPENIPVLKIESLMYNPNDYPVEYGITRIRGDINQCSINLRGDGQRIVLPVAQDYL